MYTCAFDSVPYIYHADPRNYRSYCNKNTLVPLCSYSLVTCVLLHSCSFIYLAYIQVLATWLILCLIILAGLFSSCMHTATNAPLGIGTFFGGVVAGVLSVVLIEVCVLGVVKWRQRMKEPAASKERESI